VLRVYLFILEVIMRKTTKEKMIKVLKTKKKVWNSWRKMFPSDPYLRGSDLRGSDLSNADLSNADLDFSALFLGCKSLKAKFDEKHIIQILYHAIKPCVENKIVKDPDLKKLLNSKMFQKVVNKFHRAECGKIEGAVK
jgi:hypothetical protein